MNAATDKVEGSAKVPVLSTIDIDLAKHAHHVCRGLSYLFG
jgi:hypothetical protein